MELSILDALAASKPPEPVKTTIDDNDGFAFISDGIFKMELQKMKLDDDTVNDCMHYPVSARDFLIGYFEKKKDQWELRTATTK